MFDLKCLTVCAGYWTGYFSNSKKPKSLGSILSALAKEHSEAKRTKNTTKITRPEVDVEAFLRKEERLRAHLQRR